MCEVVEAMVEEEAGFGAEEHGMSSLDDHPPMMALESMNAGLRPDPRPEVCPGPEQTSEVDLG